MERNIPETSSWNCGFSAYKRRIGELMQLNDIDWGVDDETLLSFYRMGESETFVLSSFGAISPCS